MSQPKHSRSLRLRIWDKQGTNLFVLTLRQNYPRGSDDSFSLGKHNAQDSVKHIFCCLNLSSNVVRDVTSFKAIVKTLNVWQRIVNGAIQRHFFLTSKSVNVEKMTDVSEENISSFYRVEVMNVLPIRCTATTCVNVRLLNLSRKCIFLLWSNCHKRIFILLKQLVM